MNGKSGVIRMRTTRIGRLLRRAAGPLGVLVLLIGLPACTARGPGGTARTGTEGPRLSFQERSHDFGRISYSQKTEYRFTFTNTGSRPPNISDVRPEPAGSVG